MRTWLLVACAAVCVGMISCTTRKSEPKSAGATGGARFVDAQEFKTLVETMGADTVLLDVRTPGEFAQGHIAGAQNLDFYAPDFKDRLAALDPAKNYLIYCHSGNRTRQTVTMLGAQPLKSLTVLTHGINEWHAAGFPVTEK